jgi:hypothetical protein
LISEDPLARIHREYREQCIAAGTYRPMTESELERVEQRWKERLKMEAMSVRPTRKRASGRNPKRSG